MGWIEVHCHGLDTCNRTFKVDEDLDERRCPGCGKKHTAPWDQYDGTPTSPPDSEPGDQQDVSLDASGGATIRITIEVLPEGIDR